MGRPFIIWRPSDSVQVFFFSGLVCVFVSDNLQQFVGLAVKGHVVCGISGIIGVSGRRDINGISGISRFRLKYWILR